MTLQVSPKHSKKPHPHQTNHSTRTTSAEKLRKKEKKSHEIATAHFRVPEEPTRKSVDLTPRKPAKTSTKSSVDSSISSNYSEQSESKTQSVTRHIVRVVTPFDQEREESLKLYEEACKIHNRLIRKRVERKPMTEAEEANLQQAVLDMHKALHQLHFNENLPVDRYDYSTPFFAPGEGVNFFSPATRDLYRKIDLAVFNQYLNDKIGVIDGKKHVDNNARKLAQFMGLGIRATLTFVESWKPVTYSTDPTANRKAEYAEYLKRLQDHLFALMNFEKRVHSICKNLNGEKETLRSSTAQAFCDAVRKKLSGKKSELLRPTAMAIKLHYMPYDLDAVLRKKAREIFECYQHYHPTMAIFKEKAAEKWGEDFRSSPMPNQLDEWERAIYGPDERRGIVSFLDDKGNVVLGPFEKPVGVPSDPFLNEYVLDCQYVVGKHLYNDGELMQELCRLIQEDTNLESPPLPNETLLDGQKRIMDHLTKMGEDVPRFMTFIGNIVHKLNVWNSARGDKRGPEITIPKVLEMQGRLMEFYRAPYQKFVIGPTTALRLAFPMVYPKIPVSQILRDLPKAGVVNPVVVEKKETEEPQGEEAVKLGYEANQIDITFMPHSLDVVYHTPSLICAKGTKATYTLIQKMSLKTFLGEQRKSVEVEFFYEVPDDISEEDKIALDKSVDKINVVLRAMDYAPLVQQISRKV